MADRAKSVMGGKKSKSKSKAKKSGKHPHSVHVRRGKSGGFIAEHHFKNGPEEEMQEPEEHVLPDMASLQAHMSDHMGDQPDQPAPIPDPNAAPAAPAAAVPAPAPQAAPPAGM
jgi:hypothetical protein